MLSIQFSIFTLFFVESIFHRCRRQSHWTEQRLGMAYSTNKILSNWKFMRETKRKWWSGRFVCAKWIAMEYRRSRASHSDTDRQQHSTKKCSQRNVRWERKREKQKLLYGNVIIVISMKVSRRIYTIHGAHYSPPTEDVENGQPASVWSSVVSYASSEIASIYIFPYFTWMKTATAAKPVNRVRKFHLHSIDERCLRCSHQFSQFQMNANDWMAEHTTHGNHLFTETVSLTFGAKFFK